MAEDVCGAYRGLTSLRHLVIIAIVVVTGVILVWSYVDHHAVQQWQYTEPRGERYGGIREAVREVVNDALRADQRTTPPPWDYNWDRRAGVAGAATRSILLVRHGQYDLNSGELTDIGRQQANLTGARLKALNLAYTGLVHSTMTRARQTAAIMREHLRTDMTVEADDLLCEGGPVPPQPTLSYWSLPDTIYYVDGPRMEGAFRKYFHRADQSQTSNGYQILVGHGNIFRYFTLRALQLPRAAWMRIFLPHASITLLHINQDGTVSLTKLGDSGHFPPSLVTI